MDARFHNRGTTRGNTPENAVRRTTNPLAKIIFMHPRRTTLSVTPPLAEHTDLEVIMRLSTRNQFAGKVVSITTGEAMSIVKVAIDGTDLVVTAAVTADAVADLGLTVGASTYALVKATEVQLAVD